MTLYSCTIQWNLWIWLSDESRRLLSIMKGPIHMHLVVAIGCVHQ
jgi:hypothetical protein